MQADKATHVFKKGSEFSNVVDLYNFDRELRLIVFNMIERIEVGLRTQLIYNLSNSQGAWWFENK
ncbi:MAG: abortive infection bacteriophage resistance protein [Polaribacter sp.]|jgi:abortive infection bacteriophage resistance protein